MIRTSDRAETVERRTWRVIAICAVGVFAAFRIPELTRYALWYDELFSLTLAQMSWGDMLRAAIDDRTNPPLFYVLFKAWIGVGGESVTWVRLLPCLLGIAAAVPLAWLCRRILTPWGAAATLAAAAASPLAVFLSNEIRGYSLLLLLSAASLCAAMRVVDTLGWEATILAEGDSPNALGDVAPERMRRIVQLALVNSLLAYTHYFGWLLIVAELGAVLIWDRGAARWLAMAAGWTALLVAPWVVAVAIPATAVAAPLANVDWISAPALADIPRFYDALVARVLTPRTAWVGLLVLAAVGIGFAVAGVAPGRAGRIERRRPLALFFVALVPVAIVFVASLAGRSVFVPRYLVVAAPAWWLLVGAGAEARRWLAVAFAAFTLTAGTLREVRGGEKIPWDEVVAAVAADAGPAGGTIYTLEGFTGLPAAFYTGTAHPELRVHPVSSLDAVAPPAWLVVRSSGDAGGTTLGASLPPRGLVLARLYEARVPSHGITAYRVTGR